MSPRPFRLVVLDALTAVIETVTPANGFDHDLTAAVFRGRNHFGDGDPVPMVSILEDPRAVPADVPNGASTATISEWSLLVQGFVKDDKQHPTDPAHLLLEEVKRVLKAEKLRPRDILGLGGTAPSVTSIKIGQGVVRPPDDLSAKAYFWLPVTLTLVEVN